MPELRLVTFNMWVGNRDPRENLLDLAEDLGKPHVIALQEARRFNGSIPGYERHAVHEEGNPEADNCVLLIRKRGVEIGKPRDINVRGPEWIGPKHGIIHPPRDFPGLSIEAKGLKWDILDVHRVWTGGLRRNMDAYRAEHDALVRFADQRHEKQPDRPLIILGDWNNGAGDPRPLSVSGLADRIDAKVRLKGIDGALIRNCRGSARKLDHKYGSDGHKPVEIIVRSPLT